MPFWNQYVMAKSWRCDRHLIVEPLAKYPWHLLLTQMSIQAVEQVLKKRWHVKVDGEKHQYLWLVHDAFSIALEAKVCQKRSAFARRKI